MKEFWNNLKAYWEKSADTKITIGSVTISRLAVFGIAAVILIAALIALIYLMYGSNEMELVTERIPVDAHQTYRINDSVLSFQTDDSLVKFNLKTDKEPSTAQCYVYR